MENNLPAYTVTVRGDEDISAALKFAGKYNIQISIKNTGHSYHMGSTGAGSLMIWTVHLPKYGKVETEWTNSGGKRVQDMGGVFGMTRDGVREKPLATLHIGAGQPFRCGRVCAGGDNLLFSQGDL
jgi:hypothetical protein